MIRYLLDTGLIIRHLRGHQPTVRLLRELGKGGRLCVATVTRLEVRAGMIPEERYSTQRLLSRFEHFDLDRKVADRAGEIIYNARSGGTAVQVPDAIIAATAVSYKLTLVTLNTKDFAPIPGLSLFPIN